MGFFSWDCKHCGKEILAPYPKTKWSDAVAIVKRFHNDDVLIGTYDGYGRIDGVDLVGVDDENPEIYHRHCWEEAGKPIAFSEPSNFANSQGYFIDPKTLKKDYPIDGGWKFSDECPSCKGEGWIHVEYSDEDSGVCDRCNGEGYISNKDY